MIQLEHVTKRFDDVTVVADVSLGVAAGELLVVVGGSGSGKTTLLKMINRLVRPSTGRVLIDGEDVAALGAHLLRRRIGYVFQKVGLFPHLSVAENVALPLVLLRMEKAKARARVAEVLDLVELPPSLHGRSPAQLSGGQQQRVGVARALAAEPKLMLLDEPFGALDPLTRDRLQQSFVTIRKRLGLTAVFVTHDMAEALVLADRIAVMESGRLVQVGTARELLAAPADDSVRRLLETPRRHAHIFDVLSRASSSGAP